MRHLEWQLRPKEVLRRHEEVGEHLIEGWKMGAVHARVRKTVSF